MRVGSARKTDADRRDVDVRFDRWLPGDDLLADAEAEITSDNASTTPLTVDAITLDTDSKVVKVWLSGGQAGESHEVEVTATTVEGRIKTACFTVRITSC